LRHPQTIGFAVPVAGRLPVPLWPAAPQPGVRYPPIRALHGDRDEIVPFAYTEKLVRALSRAGFDISLRRFPGAGHSLPPEVRSVILELVRGALDNP
jgi:phospholipase/carboxylesterase